MVETRTRAEAGAFEQGTALPSMVTEAPGPRSRALAARLGGVEPPTSSVIAAGQTPIFWARSRGSNVEDVDGNVYVDLTAGFCVAVAGHSNPRIVDAVARQASTLMHAPGGLNPSDVRVELAERLARLAPGDLAVSHLANTGAEAVEMALKTARLKTGRQTVIAFQGGFHGKTTGALAASSQNAYRRGFHAQLPGVVHAPYAYAYRCPVHREPDCFFCTGRYVEHLLTMPDSGVSDVAAILLEPVQGHGGWIVPPAAFVRKLRQLCDEHGILLIADEIITGCGRTGRWFGMEHFGVVPDILVVAKGLASGFPISATIMSREVAACWRPMQHTSTFLGNPVGCAAALASLAEIEERGLVGRSAELGAYFLERCRALQRRHRLIGDVRGLGLMVGIEVVRDPETRAPGAAEGRRVVEFLARRGVMATNYGGSYGNVIKMSPPLVITREQLDYALDALDASFAEAEASR
jgi:4-aminobutyrate aminotransferase